MGGWLCGGEEARQAGCFHARLARMVLGQCVCLGGLVRETSWFMCVCEGLYRCLYPSQRMPGRGVYGVTLVWDTVVHWWLCLPRHVVWAVLPPCCTDPC